MHFWPKNTFRLNIKTAISPYFRPGPGPLSFWIIFWMARTVPPSFVENGPKLRVLMIRHKPPTAKNRREPRKMTHCSETKFFGGGSSNGKVVAPGILVICSVDKNCNHHTKNWLFAPNIRILGLKKHIFAPSRQLEPHRSMFSTRKRCHIGFLIWWYRKFYSDSRNN